MTEHWHAGTRSADTPTAKLRGLNANMVMTLTHLDQRGPTRLGRHHGNVAVHLAYRGLAEWSFEIGHSRRKLWYLTAEGGTVLAAIRDEARA